MKHVMFPHFNNVRSAGYDPATETLEVQFKSSSHTYVHKSVPAEIGTGMMEARSPGTYYAANIKGKFEFEKVAPSKLPLVPVPADDDTPDPFLAEAR